MAYQEKTVLTGDERINLYNEAKFVKASNLTGAASPGTPPVYLTSNYYNNQTYPANTDIDLSSADNFLSSVANVTTQWTVPDNGVYFCRLFATSNGNTTTGFSLRVNGVPVLQATASNTTGANAELFSLTSGDILSLRAVNPTALSMRFNLSIIKL